MKICAPSVYCNLMELLNAIQHRAKLRRKHLVVQGHSHTYEEIAYAVKWSMRDRTNDLEVRRASPWDKLHGRFASGRHQIPKRERETDRRTPIDWFWPKMRPSFRQSVVKCAVRASSKECDHTSNSEDAKISTKYVDNSVENSKPMKSDRCPALTSLIFA
jgi:hypothetical protein